MFQPASQSPHQHRPCAACPQGDNLQASNQECNTLTTGTTIDAYLATLVQHRPLSMHQLAAACKHAGWSPPSRACMHLQASGNDKSQHPQRQGCRPPHILQIYACTFKRDTQQETFTRHTLLPVVLQRQAEVEFKVLQHNVKGGQAAAGETPTTSRTNVNTSYTGIAHDANPYTTNNRFIIHGHGCCLLYTRTLQHHT